MICVHCSLLFAISANITMEESKFASNYTRLAETAGDRHINIMACIRGFFYLRNSLHRGFYCAGRAYQSRIFKNCFEGKLLLQDTFSRLVYYVKSPFQGHLNLNFQRCSNTNSAKLDPMLSMFGKIFLQKNKCLFGADKACLPKLGY